MNNPIIRGFHPDPSICRKEDDYYLVTSSFEFFPAVPVFHSKDMKEWKKIGHCITNDEVLNFRGQKNSMGIFAPTIRYHDGLFYVITTDIGKGNFYVVSDDPHKGWSDPIWITPNVMGIDPSLYFEEGIAYVQLASINQGIVQFTIDLETGERTSEPQLISKGSGGRDVEAPHLFKKDAYYYLILAEGGTREGHMVTIHRSKSVWGPFESYPQNPILSNRDTKHQIQAVGHADLVEITDGKYAMVALCHRRLKHRHLLGRETVLTHAYLNDDGWIVPIEKTIKGNENDAVNQSWNFDFRTSPLDLEFNSIRASVLNRIKSVDMGIELASSNDLDVPSFIGIRQTEYQQSFELKLSLHNIENAQTGLMIYKDDHHYSKIYLIKSKEYKLIAEHINGQFTKKEEIDIDVNPSQDLVLKVDSTDYNYDFSLKADEKTYTFESIQNRHFSSEESDSMFTGVYIGPFSLGGGESDATLKTFERR